MSKMLASALMILALFGPLAPAVAQQDKATRACPGIDVAAFERRVPDQVHRYAFEHAMLEPFVQLWRSGQRPNLPLRPERVTVYALPGQPFLVGYQSGDCVIALLTVERERLLRLLRPELGWPA
jgi:hypothetical protein